ncbi:MAG TPA: prenyltransferase/squalene oxidase repeat-containing protein [Roseiflexaceae bacterium]
MKRVLFVATLLAVVAGTCGGVARASDDPPRAAQAAIGWLAPRQMADGSFPGFDAGASADAIFAIASVGSDPNGVLKDGHSPVSFLGTQATSYASKSVAAASKLALAVITANKNPLDFGGQNLIASIVNGYDTKTGRYGATTTDHAFALLALASAGQPIPQAAIAALNGAQLPDGGWSFDGKTETGSDTNTTALAVQAFVAANPQGDLAPIARLATAKAITYLHSQQNADGGFPYAKSAQYGADTDANSTAAVIQALVAANEDPRGWRQSGGDPIDALLALQNPSGAFRYQAALPDDNDLATAQAVPALMLKPFPLKKVALPAVQPESAPPPAPKALPKTGGAPELAWLLIAALALIATGLALRSRRT